MKKLFLLALMAAAFSTTPEAEAKNTNLLNFQGTLKDAKNAVVSKNMNVVFKIYDTPTGGAPIWTEANSITIEEGYFNVYLGARQDFIDVNFSKELYLEITLDNGEVLPRTRLTASPFAFNAGIASEADTANIAKSVIEGVLKWKNFEPKELAAGGMLSGSYPNPTLNFEKVLTGIPANSIDGSKIMPGTYPHINATPTGVAYGDMEGSVFPTLNLKKDVIDVRHIKKDAVTELALKDGSVTEPKLAKDAVTTDKILKEAVTDAKLAKDAVTTDKIKDDAVTEVKIVNDAVTTNKIKDAAVTNAKLAENAVLTANIKDGQVTDKKLADGAVVFGKIAEGAVDSVAIQAGAVTNTKLAKDAVREEHIYQGSVTEIKIADAAVTSNKIKDGAVIAGKLGDNAVLTANIKDGQVTDKKLADGAVVFGKIAEGAVDSVAIQAGAVTNTKLAKDAVREEHIFEGSVTEVKIADAAVTSNKIKDGAVIAGKLGDNAVLNVNIAEGAITADKISGDAKNKSKVLQLDPTGKAVWNDIAGGLNQFNGKPTTEGQMFIFHNGEWQLTTGDVPTHNTVLKYSDISKRYTWEKDNTFELPYINDDAKSDPIDEDLIRIKRTDERANKVMHLENSKSKGQEVLYVKGAGSLAHRNGVVNIEASSGSTTATESTALKVSNFSHGNTTKTSSAIQSNNKVWDVATDAVEHKGIESKIESTRNNGANYNDKGSTIALDGEAKGGNLAIGSSLKVSEASNAIGVRKNVIANNDAWGTDATVTAKNRNAMGTKEAITGQVNATGTDATITAETGDGMGRKMTLTGQKTATGFESAVTAKTDNAFGNKMTLTAEAANAVGTTEAITGKLNATGTDATITAEQGDGMGRKMTLTGQNTATGFESAVTAKTDNAFGSKMTLTAEAANAVGTTEAITGKVNATGTDATITAEQGDAVGRKMTLTGQNTATGFESAVTAKTDDAFGSKMTLTAEAANAIGTTETITGKVNAIGEKLSVLAETGDALGRNMFVTAAGVDKEAFGSYEMITSEQGHASGRNMSVTAQGVDKEALGSYERIKSEQGDALGRNMFVTAEEVDKIAFGSGEDIISTKGEALGRRMEVTAQGVDKEALGSKEFITSEQGDALGRKMLVSASAAGKKAIGSDIRVEGDAGTIGVYAADKHTLAPKDGVSASVYANATKGNALYAEGAPAIAKDNYVAQVKATNNGRSMYIEGGDWNRNLIKKEAAGEDKDNAALVVRANADIADRPANVTAALGTPAWAGYEGKTAIKTYGDIWANSAIGATTIVGLEKVVVGTEEDKLTIITPPTTTDGPVNFDRVIEAPGAVFNGTDEAKGGIKVVKGTTETFKVTPDGDVTAHDATINGTLDVTGTTSFTGKINAKGGIEVKPGTTAVFGVTTTGNVTASGEVQANGGLKVDDKFTVADGSGNITAGGTAEFKKDVTIGAAGAGADLSVKDGNIKVTKGTAENFTVDNTGNVVTKGTITQTHAAANAVGTTETITGQVDATGTDATITATTGAALGRKMTIIAQGVDKTAVGSEELIKSEQGSALGKKLTVRANEANKTATGSTEIIESAKGDAVGRYLSVTAKETDKEALGSEAFITSNKGAAKGKYMSVTAKGEDSEALGSEEYIRSEQAEALGRLMSVRAQGVGREAFGSVEYITSLQGDAKGIYLRVKTEDNTKKTIGADIRVKGGASNIGIYAADKHDLAPTVRVSASIYGKAKKGNALYAEGSPDVAANNYVAQVKATNNGRSMYIEGGDWNHNLIKKEAAGEDKDNAALVVRANADIADRPANVTAALATPAWAGAEGKTAIKTYGDIWGSSAIGATTIVGLEKLVVGTEAGRLTTITPPATTDGPVNFDRTIGAPGARFNSDNDEKGGIKVTKGTEDKFIVTHDGNVTANDITFNGTLKVGTPDAANTNKILAQINNDGTIGFIDPPSGGGTMTGTQIVTAINGGTDKIGVAKLADGEANQILVTSSDGNSTQWSSDLTVPGNLTVNGAIKYSVSSEIIDVANLKVANASITPTVVQLGAGITGTVTSVQLGNPATGVGTIKYIINNSGATLTIAGATVANGKTATVICTTADDTNPVWTVIAVTP